MSLQYFPKYNSINWDNRNYSYQYERKSVFKSELSENYPKSIIIDNGSFECRAGFNIFESPSVIVKSIVGKSKTQTKGYFPEIVIGEDLMKADPGRYNKKSPFEKNLVYHFNTQEALFDYIFKNLNIRDQNVDYPIVLTESFMNTTYSRKIVNEMIFELYGAPSLSLGVDCLFSAYKNKVVENKDYLIISSSSTTTHIIPVLDGKPLPEFSRRISIGGLNGTELLTKSLALKYPVYKNKFTPEICQFIKENYTECSIDYTRQSKVLEKLFLNEQERIKVEEIKNLYGSIEIYNKVIERERLMKIESTVESSKKFAITNINNNSKITKNDERLFDDFSFVFNNPKIAKDENSLLKAYKNKVLYENEFLELQLNNDKENINPNRKLKSNIINKSSSFIQNELHLLKWPEEYKVPEISEEEIKKKQEIRQEQGRKLKELLAQKREEKLNNMKIEIAELESLKKQKATIDSDQWAELLQSNDFEDEEELNDQIKKLHSKLNAKKDNDENKDEEVVIDEDEKWPLINVPDEELDETQIRQKRMQKLQRNGYYMRIEKKELAKKEKEQIDYLKNSDPENYMITLFAKKKAIIEKLENFKKIRKELLNRRSKVNISRMMVLAELGKENTANTGRSKREKVQSSNKKGKDKNIHTKAVKNKKNKDKEGDDDFGENDEDWDIYRGISKQNLSDEEDEEKTQLIEVENKILEVYPDYENRINNSSIACGLNSEFYNNCYLGIDQFREAEIIFKPYLIGVDQAGVIELISSVLKFFNKNQRSRLLKNVFICGGNMAFPHMEERIYNEIRQLADYETEVNIIKAEDCCLDSWRGAALFSKSTNNREYFISRADYLEKGYEYIKEHCCSNTFSK